MNICSYFEKRGTPSDFQQNITFPRGCIPHEVTADYSKYHALRSCSLSNHSPPSMVPHKGATTTCHWPLLCEEKQKTMPKLTAPNFIHLLIQKNMLSTPKLCLSEQGYQSSYHVTCTIFFFLLKQFYKIGPWLPFKSLQKSVKTPKNGNVHSFSLQWSFFHHPCSVKMTRIKHQRHLCFT